MGNPLGGVPASGVTERLVPTALTQGAEKAKAGQSNGRTVIASNPGSLAAASNMSEEITALVAKFKKPDDFKVSKGKTESERQLELIEKIKIVEEIHGVEDFSRHFPEESKQDYTKEDFLKEGKKQLPDPFHRYVAFYDRAVAFEAGPDDAIFQAIRTLENEHPEYIEYGKQISEAAGLLAEKYSGDTSPQIRENVFGHVEEHKSLAAAFKKMYKDAGIADNQPNAVKEEKFLSAINTDLKASSNQLGMMTSSTEDTHIRSVINQMTTSKRIVGIHDSAMETQRQISRPPHNVQPFDGHHYMEMVLNILDEPFVVTDHFVGLMKNMGMEDQPVATRIFLINKTAQLIRDIPEEVFANQQIKDSLVSAIGDEQDTLALEEESDGVVEQDYARNKGEVEVDLAAAGFVLPGDILGDIGISLKGRNESAAADVAGSDEAKAVVNDESAQRGTKSASGKAGGSKEKQPEMPLDSVASRPPKRTAQDVHDEPSGKVAKTSLESANSRPAEVTAKGSVDGLSENELMRRQDELLDKARGLQAKKDEDFVYGCSLTALEYALNNDADTLSALDNVAKQRGKGQFAKGLKIAITPEGSGKEIRLIPPDKKALQEWKLQNPDGNFKDLVSTAIAVLKENRDSSFDLEKINKELVDLKVSVSEIDEKMKKRHTNSLKDAFKNPRQTPFLRPLGVDAFDAIEFPHKFRVSADQKASGNITAEALTPEKGGAPKEQNKTQAAQQE